MTQHNGTGCLGYGMMHPMDRRLLTLLLMLAAALACVSLSFVGDTTVDLPDPVAPPAATPMAPAAPSADVARAPQPNPQTPSEPPAPAFQPTPTLQVKSVDRAPPSGQGGVYDGSQLRGVASAMMDQAPAIQDCYRDWSEQHGELPGRFTLQVTVPAGGDDPVPAEAVLPFAWPEGESLEDCIGEVLADTTFVPPGERDFQIMWPVPRVLDPMSSGL